MVEIKDLIKVALEQLDKRKEELKKELLEQRDIKQAIEALEAKTAELREQLECLVNLPVPMDLLDFYVKSNGRIWVSKLCGFNEGDSFQITRGGRIINYSERFGSTTAEGLPTGAYRFIVLAIPQEIPKSQDKVRKDTWKDEYGDIFRRG